MIPLDFAFPNMNENDQVGQDAFSAFGYVVDAIFIIDVILTMNTSFIDTNGEENFNKADIRRNYLKLWFWIDLIACFPLEILISRTNLSEEHKKQLHRDVQQASTNAKAVLLLSRQRREIGKGRK